MSCISSRAALLSLAGLVVFIGCSRQSPPASPSVVAPEVAAPEVPPPHSNSLTSKAYRFHPLREGIDKAAVYRDLEREVPVDPETVALLKRLHGNLTLAVRYIKPLKPEMDKRTPEETDAYLKAWSAPPPAGVAVLCLLTFQEHNSFGFKDGKNTTELLGPRIDHSVSIWFPKKPVELANPTNAPEQSSAMLLAVNDYLLRKNKGVVLSTDDPTAAGKDVPFGEALCKQFGTDQAKFRSYLDEKVEAQDQAFRKYWTDRGIELK